MSKSNRGSALGRRSGTVTVIEEPVRRSAARKSKIVFWVVWISVTLLAATVAASPWHPIIALFAGILTGLATALIVAACVLIWPVVRTIWWWAPEIALAFGLVTGWVWLADHTTLTWRLIAVILIAGVPAAIPHARRLLIAIGWCLVTRHRLRTCFAQFIITNRLGSLPHIMLARPTAVGERVWLWLRPGLALDDIQSRLDLIAVACWADTAVAEAASDTNSALVRIDIKRRDALTPRIASPLLRMITLGTPGKDRDTTQVPTALDLPDVHPDDVAPAKPEKGKKAPAPVPSPVPDTASDPDDVSDWL
jgi:hypothetical protein